MYKLLHLTCLNSTDPFPMKLGKKVVPSPKPTTVELRRAAILAFEASHDSMPTSSWIRSEVSLSKQRMAEKAVDLAPDRRKSLPEAYKNIELIRNLFWALAKRGVPREIVLSHCEAVGVEAPTRSAVLGAPDESLVALASRLEALLASDLDRKRVPSVWRGALGGAYGVRKEPAW